MQLLLKSPLTFQHIIPNQKPIFETDRSIEIKIQYIYGATEIIEKMTTGDIKYIAQQALYDTIGDYLNHYLIPVTKYSYYAGEITYKTTKYLYELFDYCKKILNTNGIGWRPPINNFKNFTNKIQPIQMDEEKNEDVIDENEQTPCVNLILLGDDINDLEEDMLIALPKIELDENGELISIWLPFKRKHNFNVEAKSSAFILMRYFVSVTKCYRFEGNSQEIFNQNFEKWLKENISPFLHKKNFYPAFGAVLRILETVKNHKTTKAGKSEEIADEFIELEQEVDKIAVTSEEPTFFEKLIHPISKLKEKEESSTNLSKEEQEEKNNIIKITVLLILIVTIVIIIIAAFIKMKRKRKLSSTSLSSSQKSNKSREKINAKINEKDEEIALSERSSAIMSDNESKKLKKGKTRTNILNCSKKQNLSDSSEYSFEPIKIADTAINIDPIENTQTQQSSLRNVAVTQQQSGILRESEIRQERRGIFNKKKTISSFNFLK